MEHITISHYCEFYANFFSKRCDGNDLLPQFNIWSATWLLLQPYIINLQFINFSLHSVQHYSDPMDGYD